MNPRKLFLFPLLLLLTIASQAQIPVAPATATTPLFASDEEIENFLLTAKIVKSKGIGVGVANPLKLTLDDGRIQHYGVFKAIDEHKSGATRLAQSTEIDFKDSWMFEVAAYKLDRLLGLNMVPVTVERSYNGHKGSLQFWVNNCMTEGDRMKQKLNPPNPVSWRQQIYKVRVFDNLVYNIDRNLGNLLISGDWKLYMIDHSRTFKSVDALKSPKDLTYFSRSFVDALRKLDEASVTAKCEKYVSTFEVKTLLKRRDRLVQLYDQLLAEKGEGITYP